MIKSAHPKDRADRRRLTEHYEKKKHKGAFKRREEIRDEETANELDAYRTGDPTVDL